VLLRACGHSSTSKDAGYSTCLVDALQGSPPLCWQHQACRESSWLQHQAFFSWGHASSFSARPSLQWKVDWVPVGAEVFTSAWSVVDASQPRDACLQHHSRLAAGHPLLSSGPHSYGAVDARLSSSCWETQWLSAGGHASQCGQTLAVDLCARGQASTSVGKRNAAAHRILAPQLELMSSALHVRSHAPDLAWGGVVAVCRGGGGVDEGVGAAVVELSGVVDGQARCLCWQHQVCFGLLHNRSAMPAPTSQSKSPVTRPSKRATSAVGPLCDSDGAAVVVAAALGAAVAGAGVVAAVLEAALPEDTSPQGKLKVVQHHTFLAGDHLVFHSLEPAWQSYDVRAGSEDVVGVGAAVVAAAGADVPRVLGDAAAAAVGATVVAAGGAAVVAAVVALVVDAVGAAVVPAVGAAVVEPVVACAVAAAAGATVVADVGAAVAAAVVACTVAAAVGAAVVAAVGAAVVAAVVASAVKAACAVAAAVGTPVVGAVGAAVAAAIVAAMFLVGASVTAAAGGGAAVGQYMCW